VTEDRDNLPELPTGWVWAKTGDICEGIVPGRTKPKNFNGTIPWITLPDVTGLYISKSQNNLAVTREDAEEVGMRVMPKGTVLMSCVGQFGIICIAEDELVPNQQFHGFLCLDKIFSEYIAYSLMTQVDQMEQLSSATTIAYINKTKCNSIQIPLAPLNEQRRIVAKIEALKARSQRVKEELEAIAPLLDQFRQSVLAAAFRGDLTADWREKNPDVEPASELLKQIQKEREERYEQACIKAKREGKQKPRKIFPQEIPLLEDECLYDLPESWAITNINFLAHVTKLAGFEYTKYIKLEDLGEIPVVRAQNVQMGKFVKENIKYISKETSDLLERSQLHGREILMVFIGAGTGNVCLAPQERRWHLAPNVAKIDIDGIFNKYLLFYLQSPIGQRTTLSWAKATAQPSLSMETIRKISVYVPPLAEQQEIVRWIESLLQVANQVEQQYKQAKAHLAQLDRSILAKAFRGELVPQDSNDEPASVLLERIRAEREKLDTKKKAKGKTEKKSDKAKPEAAEPKQLSLPGFE
jgi:type I restriction enzyme S subunit